MITEPRTEAGRELLEREAFNARSFALITTDAILAIEAEAARLAVEDVAERVRALHDDADMGAYYPGEDNSGPASVEAWNAALAAVLVLLSSDEEAK